MQISKISNKSTFFEKLKNATNVVFVVLALCILAMICIGAALVDTERHLPKSRPKYRTPYVRPYFNHTSGLSIPDILYGCPSLKPGMLITVDDGPSDKTKDILQIMKKVNITGLFFLYPSKMKSHKNVVKQILNDGHEIGFLIADSEQHLKSSEDLKDQIHDAEEILDKIAPHMHLRFIRFSTGAINREYANVTESLGYIVVLWNAATQRIDGNDHTFDKEVATASLAHVPKHGAILSLPENTKITELLFKQIDLDLDKQDEKFFSNTFLSPKQCFDM